MTTTLPLPARPARSRTRVLVLVVALAIVVIACESTGTPTPTTTPTAGSVDPTHLPLGDGKYASSAKRGFIYTCQATFGGGGGAGSRGPWFNADGTTWDSTKKLEVSGSVKWTPTFTTAIVGGQRTFTGNDLPAHGTGKYPIPASDPVYAYDRNPGSISAQVLSVKVPASPTVAATPTCIRGEVGVLLTGVALFDAFDAGGRDAVAWEAQDSCQGHPQNTGVYHYHRVTSCGAAAKAGKAVLVGFAYDGFPIYIERDAKGQLPTNADLDACHGHTSAVPLDGKTVTTYHYSATLEFPYTVGCFKGVPTQNQFSGH